MSEYLPNTNGDEEFDNLVSGLDAELDTFLQETYGQADKKAATIPSFETAENTPLFHTAFEYQKVFDTLSFTSLEELMTQTGDVVRQLDAESDKAKLMYKSISLIGSPESILLPQINFNPLEMQLAIYPQPHTDDQAIAIRGTFNGFIVKPVLATPPQSAENNEVRLKPRLYYHTYVGDYHLGMAAMSLFAYGEVGKTSVFFEQSYPELSLTSAAGDSPEEKAAVIHVNRINKLLGVPQPQNDVANALRKTEKHAFYLLNKSAYAEATILPDLLIDTVSHHIQPGTNYDIRADFALEQQPATANNPHRFTVSDRQTDDGVTLPSFPLTSISVLPRSTLKKTARGLEGVINPQQRALYLTLATSEEVIHIPFEYIRTMKPSSS